jgi:hypothetical protein
MIYVANTLSWDTPIKNNMDDPEFRRQIEGWLNLKFPESVQWEKSELRPWLEWDFQCVFTLPKKDIDLLIPPEKGEWHENDHDMLPHWSEEWLKGKNIDRFKTMRYESRTVSKCHVKVAYEDPIEADENQRIWVYIYAWDT